MNLLRTVAGRRNAYVVLMSVVLMSGVPDSST